MKDHYGFSDETYKSLVQSGITDMDLFKSIKLFDPNGSNSEISKVSLFYYIDEKGDFNLPPLFPHKKIAKALFNDLPIKDKIEVAEYLDYATNGEFDE